VANTVGWRRERGREQEQEQGQPQLGGAAGGLSRTRYLYTCGSLVLAPFGTNDRPSAVVRHRGPGPGGAFARTGGAWAGRGEAG
jgi:hypothetical protein